MYESWWDVHTIIRLAKIEGFHKDEIEKQREREECENEKNQTNRLIDLKRTTVDAVLREAGYIFNSIASISIEQFNNCPFVGGFEISYELWSARNPLGVAEYPIVTAADIVWSFEVEKWYKDLCGVEYALK